MATYQELLAQYNALPPWGNQRQYFLNQHPKFAAKLTGGGDTSTGGTTGSTTDSQTSGWWNWPDWGGGGGTTTPSSEEETDRPPQPTTPLPEGWTWVWDDALKQWVPQQGEAKEEEDKEEDQTFKNDLLARINDLLEQFDLNTPGLLDFAKQAIAKGWGINEFMLELRRHPDYLANPLFAANIERTKQGKRFMSEAEVLAYAGEAKRLARQFGYEEPSNNYVAAGLLSGLSLAEVEHRLAVQDRVNQFGLGVGMVYREVTGSDPSDQDLYEIFDPEISTDEIDNALRQAEYRGRPFTLGLGIRTEAEARAAEMMGITPDEWFSRFQGVSQNAPRFERLRAVEEVIGQGLPDNFGSHLMTVENGLLIRALVFQDQSALAQLQDATAREIARFKQGGGPATTGGGQLVGLLGQEERATYG